MGEKLTEKWSVSKKICYTVMIFLIIAVCMVFEITHWNGWGYSVYEGSSTMKYLTGCFGGFVTIWESVFCYLTTAPLYIFLFYFTVAAKRKSRASRIIAAAVIALLVIAAFLSWPESAEIFRKQKLFRGLRRHNRDILYVMPYVNFGLVAVGLLLCLVRSIPKLTAGFREAKGAKTAYVTLIRVALIVLAVFAITAMSACILNFTGLSKKFSTLVLGYSARGVDAFKMMFCAPVFEELGFRGLSMGKLKRTLPAWAAIVISSICFGIWHRNLPQFAYTVVFGTFSALVYLYTNNLLYSIFAHFMMNWISAMAMTKSGWALLAKAYGVLQKVSVPVAIVLAAVCCAVCVGSILIIRKTSKVREAE